MNLFDLILIQVIVFIILFIYLIRWFLRSNIKKIIKNCIFIASFVFYFLAVYVSYMIFMSDFKKPSSVDISPFLEISNVSFSNIDATIQKLQQSEGKLGNQFEVTNVLMVEASCKYKYKSGPSSTTVSIYLFRDSGQAKEYFNELSHELQAGSINEGFINGSAGLYIEKSENIEAILGDSSLSRSADTFYELGGRGLRVIGTSVRINNMYIKFFEYGHDDETIGQTTSEAIKRLCKVLAK